jgi:hypothetical protein
MVVEINYAAYSESLFGTDDVNDPWRGLSKLGGFGSFKP